MCVLGSLGAMGKINLGGDFHNSFSVVHIMFAWRIRFVQLHLRMNRIAWFALREKEKEPVNILNEQKKKKRKTHSQMCVTKGHWAKMNTI